MTPKTRQYGRRFDNLYAPKADHSWLLPLLIFSIALGLFIALAADTIRAINACGVC